MPLGEGLAVPLLGAASVALLVPTILAGDVRLRALLVAATLLVVTALVVKLRGRIDRLIGELDRAATTDPLTGLVNRRRFDESFAREIERQGRTNNPLALLILDLDHFKRINDSHGHEAGDRVLREFAALIEAETRAVDIVARLGGDEFAVLAPDTGAEGAAVLAQRLRERTRDAFSERPEQLTVSCGVAVAPADGTDQVALSRAADRALYRAKVLGRDLVALAIEPGAYEDSESVPLSSTK
jgi:diguanylate cyclase (GGDEF)-like protein